MDEIENQKLKRKFHILSILFFLTGLISGFFYYAFPIKQYGYGYWVWWKHAIVITYISLAILSAIGLWFYKKWGRMLGVTYGIISAGVFIAVILNKASILSNENEWSMPVTLTSWLSTFITLSFFNILIGSREKVIAEIKAEVKNEEEARKEGLEGQAKKIIFAIVMYGPHVPTIMALHNIWNLKRFSSIIFLSAVLLLFATLWTITWLAYTRDILLSIARSQSSKKLASCVIALLILVGMPILSASFLYNYYWIFPFKQLRSVVNLQQAIAYLGKVLLNICYLWTCLITTCGIVGYITYKIDCLFLNPKNKDIKK